MGRDLERIDWQKIVMGIPGGLKMYPIKERVYKCLRGIPEFNSLSMDRQGEIVLKVVELIKE